MMRSLNISKIEKQYTRTITALTRVGILTPLPRSKKLGVLGIDGKKYPVPTLAQVLDLFSRNSDLVARKVPQGFDRLILSPLAMPLPVLFDLMKGSILKHAAEGKIFQARRSASEPQTPVRVNQDKQVWTWDVLTQAIDSGELVYFPQEYSPDHHGQTKLQVIKNKQICAFPGWSVGLVESSPFIPQQGQGKTLAGRRQLEIGFSPNEYMLILRSEPYLGETGKTLEDFISGFLTRLETTNEVSNDVVDNNGLWCLAHYLKISYADLVPTANWFRSVGRHRLGMHRTNNKKCTKSFGASTVGRLGD